MGVLDFLNWILYSGGVNVLVSAVLEYIPQFKVASADAKKVVVVVLNVLVVAGVYAVEVYVPADLLVKIDPLFKIIAGLFLPYAAQQAYHKLTKVSA